MCAMCAYFIQLRAIKTHVSGLYLAPCKPLSVTSGAAEPLEQAAVKTVSNNHSPLTDPFEPPWEPQAPYSFISS